MSPPSIAYKTDSSSCESVSTVIFKKPIIKITRSHSVTNIGNDHSYEISADYMRRSSLEEISENMQNRLDKESENIMTHGGVSDENSLKKKTYLMNMFRTAVFKVITNPENDSNEDSIAPLPDDPSSVVTLLPTQKTKAIYLSRVFKYAVKQTIIQHRQEKMSGDPWDEFFYRIYTAEKPRMESVGSSKEVKLNINKELEEKLAPSPFDPKVRDKLSSHRNASSTLNTRGKKAIDNLTRLSATISKHKPLELGKIKDEQPETLPKLPPRRKKVAERGRFNTGKVRHSPDGRSPLSRLFYLPLVSSAKKN